jgi:hypothetical protein
MEFDPFAPESLSQSAQAAETKPSFSGKVKSKMGTIAMQAGAIMWFAGSMIAFDQANAQQVAVATPSQWKLPIAAGPAVPGNVETTTEEAPTAEAVIEILRNGKELIKKKFPNYNDTAFQQIVGQISLGTVKSETLVALAGAFVEGSPEQKAVLNFWKIVSTQKPDLLPSPPDAGGKKLPPLNETKEQKEKRLAEERLIKIKDEIIREFNKDILRKESWASLKINSSNKNNDADATVSKDNWWLIFAMKQKNRTLAQAFFKKEFLAGKYTVTLEGSNGKYVIYWPGGQEIIVKPGVPTTFEVPRNMEIYFNVLPDRINPEITVTKITLEKASPAKIANN